MFWEELEALEGAGVTLLESVGDPDEWSASCADMAGDEEDVNGKNSAEWCVDECVYKQRARNLGCIRDSGRVIPKALD